MKPNTTNQTTDTPINVVFLGKSIYESKEDIILDYIDLLKSCKTAQDFHGLFDQMFDDIVERTGSWIIERQIQKNVEILQEIGKSK